MELLQWKCKKSFVVLGQSNDRIEDNLSALISHGDLGCMKGNLVWEMNRVFQAVGYHTFMLPCEMGYDTLAHYSHLMKLPMFISMKMAFNEDAIKYNDIIGLCPYSSNCCSELRTSIVDGANLQLQAMKFTKDNVRWCCGDEIQTKFGGFAFFSGRTLSKGLLHKIGVGL